ncbi:DUF4249 domain-containing protein [Pontibacter litorisediminis]|uniref:DUF4249 domain-containing protein n=1 Tax=Pontibacter litorisediminis TaxID=1846260 RepID=UPI0023EDBD51|nr:DUF4249 domain-containing protein [Pontibacter litorisediminis]
MQKLNVILAILWSLLLFGCEEDITIDIPAGEEQLVVEGHIEQDAPPVVILTRTVPVFTEVSAAALAQSFVHDAQVRITVDGQTYTLKEVPSTAFSEELKQLLQVQFGLKPELFNTPTGLVFYIYTSEELRGQLGKTYSLQINHDGRTLSSVTTIPQLNPLDSLWTIPHPNRAQDSLRQLYYRYSDPDTLGNYVRYFTKRNDEPFYPGLFASVFSDEFINGATIVYPLDRGEPKGQPEVDVDLYSYFGKGDTITVRWAAIDLAHYRFWFTLENEQNNNGSPISSPNITQSNIEGGLGIWGGYAVSRHTLLVE